VIFGTSYQATHIRYFLFDRKARVAEQCPTNEGFPDIVGDDGAGPDSAA